MSVVSGRRGSQPAAGCGEVEPFQQPGVRRALQERADVLDESADVQRRELRPEQRRVADACEICYHLVSTGVRAQERAAEALAYNGLVRSWPESVGSL